MSGMLRGIDVYYSPYDKYSETLAVIIANNFMSIYPLPDKCSAKPTTTLGEVTQTKAPAVLCEIGYHDNRIHFLDMIIIPDITVQFLILHMINQIDNRIQKWNIVGDKDK